MRHAVKRVNEETDRQPNAETDPCVHVQFHHQVNVQKDAQARDERDQRYLWYRVTDNQSVCAQLYTEYII